MRIAFRERSAVFDFSETRFLISVFGWIQLLREHKELSLLRERKNASVLDPAKKLQLPNTEMEFSERVLS